MSEVIHDTQHEFWRPPVAERQAAVPVEAPETVEACDGCSSEFMVGARFCYVCGSPRVMPSPESALSWTRYFEFHHIKQALGLPVPALVAFLIGLGCLLATISVGFIYAVQNFADFQAIQFWRMEWLLAAIAAFVAAILLRRTGSARK
jgi:hypothetical protein